MKNCRLLIEKNVSTNSSMYYLKVGVLKVKHRAKQCSGSSLYSKIIFPITSAIKRYRGGLKKIIIEFDKVEFVDKLTYITLESICYSIITHYSINVIILGEYIGRNIFRGGISDSPLNCLLNSKSNEYTKKFTKMTISKNHYRRIVSGAEREDSSIFGDIMTQIKSFLVLFCNDKTYRSEVAEVVVELAGNAWEHTKTDCLIDIDIKENCSKKSDLYNEKYYGINIVVLNFSEQLLGDELKEKINSHKYKEDATRYCELNRAYEYHSNEFNEYYTEEDFFNIASFQNKISGRIDKDTTGGRGLPRLIAALEKQSEIHKCYVISGNNVLWFKLPYLEYNTDEWIGFNESKRFQDDIPDMSCISRSDVYFPGTAFNLNFAMKQEEK